FSSTVSTPIPTLPLLDALPISQLVSHSHASPTRLMVQSQAPESTCLTCSMVAAQSVSRSHSHAAPAVLMVQSQADDNQPCRLRIDRKSTRLNSSHVKISYAVFC